MADMQQFSLWFIQNIPVFLSAQPIIYIVGLVITTFIVKLFLIMGGKR